MEALFTFASKLLATHGLQKTVLAVLVLGMAISAVLYTFPPIFEAAGDILSFELRNAHASIDE